jgi:hypothetical protein
MLRWLLLIWLAATFLAFGVMQLAVAWFGLREGHAWALWTLVVGDLVALPYWAAMIRTYIRHGAPLGAGTCRRCSSTSLSSRSPPCSGGSVCDRRKRSNEGPSVARRCVSSRPNQTLRRGSGPPSKAPARP